MASFLQPLLTKSLSLPSVSFLFVGLMLLRSKLLASLHFGGCGKMDCEKKTKVIYSFIQTAPIKCNQVQAGKGLAVLETNQGTKAHSHMRSVLMSPLLSPENNAGGTWTES